MILGQLKVQPAPQRPVQAAVLDSNSVTYFACCSIFCSCFPLPPINNLIRSFVISSTADTTEHQVQGGLLWGTLSIKPVKVGMHNYQETSWFYIPGQFKWLATLQSLMLRFLENHHEKTTNRKKRSLPWSAPTPGASCVTHKQRHMCNVPALNLGFMKNVYVFTISVCFDYSTFSLECSDINLSVG